jgi:hypothetical protein
MINKITEQITTKRIVSITCDICGKTYDTDMETQEFHFVQLTGGFGSVFGDETTIECDVCQYCLYEMIKGKYRER